MFLRANCSQRIYNLTTVFNIIEHSQTYVKIYGQIDVIYTDLEKAFDKVPHQKLVEKLDIQSKPWYNWLDMLLSV